MNRWTKLALPIAIATLLGVSAGLFYFTPHMAVREMRTALDARDADRLNRYVDFTALRHSVKENLNQRIQGQGDQANQNDKPAGLGALFGRALASALVNPVVDAVVSPQGIALLMEGEKNFLKPGRNGKAPAEPGPASTESKTGDRKAASAEGEAPRSKLEVNSTYEAFDRFAISVRKKSDPGEPIVLILHRSGLIHWKLAAVRLPA